MIRQSASRHPAATTWPGLLLILGWVGAIATSFIIRAAYDRRWARRCWKPEAGEAALRDREQARRIARERPALAQQMGIGRPDVDGAVDAGLVDVNNASVTALLKLPGVDGDVATEIIEGREKIDGFSVAGGHGRRAGPRREPRRGPARRRRLPARAARRYSATV